MDRKLAAAWGMPTGDLNRRGHRFADIAATMREFAVLTLVIGILIIVVIGAILFWVIDKFCPDARLAQLLKLLVVLICAASILQRVLPLIGLSGL